MLDSTNCKMLLDMEALSSFMSKSYYMKCPSIHGLPVFF